jgi:hypothetical protein
MCSNFKEKIMMWCSDPFLNYLKSFGYCIVRLPKADIKPLLILSKQGGSLDRLGELTTLLLAGDDVPLPTISENIPAANISGQRTSNISIGIGLSILSSILNAMGGTKLGLDTKYQQAKTVAFEFHNVLEDRVELAKLDQYLADADVNPHSRHVREILETDRLYVTTATIKSQKLTVEARRSDGSSVELSVPEIQDIVGVNVKVSGQGASTSKLSYEGRIPLVFGIQAVQLFYDQGSYTRFEPVESVGMREGSTSNNIVRQLETEAPFLRLNGE